jgi:hypothetical protein
MLLIETEFVLVNYWEKHEITTTPKVIEINKQVHAGK